MHTATQLRTDQPRKEGEESGRVICYGDDDPSEWLRGSGNLPDNDGAGAGGC